MLEVENLEAGGNISLSIHDFIDEEDCRSVVDALDKVLENLAKVGLPFERRDMEKDGNCWWSSIADQIVLHNLDYPSSHDELRSMVINSADLHPNKPQWTESLFGNDRSAWEAWKNFQLRDGSFTDEWGIVQHITAFYLDTNIHIVGTANTESNPFTVIASSNNLDLEFWVGYTQDYEGLKDGHYDSLKCLDNFAIDGFTSGIRLESGTAQMSADSIVLDSDLGLFSDGSIGSEGDAIVGPAIHSVDDDVFLPMDAIEEDLEEMETPDVEPVLPSEPKNVVCKK